MQDFFQTFWEILVQNRTRLIFIFLSSLVLHVLFRRLIESITKFLFVTIRSFFFKDVKLFYDYRWQKSRKVFRNQYLQRSSAFYFPQERLLKHYHENLKLIHKYDTGNSTNYLNDALKNSKIKKVLDKLLDLFYLKVENQGQYHLLYKKWTKSKVINKSSFDMNEMSYASFIYRYNFIYKSVLYNEFKSVQKMEEAFKNLLTKYQLFTLQQKTDYLFQINFYVLYFKWLWVVLKLNIRAFKLYFDDALLLHIDKQLESLFDPMYLHRLNYNENMAWWNTKTSGNWPYQRLEKRNGERKGMLFRRDTLKLEEWDKIKDDIQYFKKKSTLLIYPLFEFNRNGEKIIDFEKFKHRDLIHSFQSDNYVDSKHLKLGHVQRKIIRRQINFYGMKGKGAKVVLNKMLNRINLNGVIANASWNAKWYYNFKTCKTEFKFKYFEINDDTIDSFKELVLFVNNELALAQESEKFSSLDNETAAIRSNFLMVRCDKTSQGLQIYKEYFNKLGSAALKFFIISKNSWFFNSSNRIFDTYLNSVGFLLFFIIAFVLEEIYSEPVIGFIEKTTTFFSSLF